MNNSIIHQIDKNKLCLGCGFCESICGKESVEMKLGIDGFFHPEVKKIDIEKEKVVKEICPGLNVINDLEFEENETIWGKIEKLYSGYSYDSEVRTKGSSGGIVSAIAIHLLETKIVDSVLQVGGDANDYERNTLNISKTKEDVLRCASSRYAPALIFNEILHLLSDTNDVFCFIGKPCDISALKNFLNKYPQFKNRFKLTVSIICAGMPSFSGTKAIIDEFKAELPVKNLIYRGNGWPGYFSFIDKKGTAFRKTYNDSWGKTLNRYLNFRCKICPDGIGLQADIAVGDAWDTKDGYPDFTEKEGHSLIIVRTQQGINAINDALNDKQIFVENLALEKVGQMQPYQYARRTRVGARLLAFYLVNFRVMVNFDKLRIFSNMKLVPKKTLANEFLGTFKRLVNR
ncbi:Coenzyme F420 hydrogenase/dehydrogenase, beta subunit C-terminal domain [Arcicella sp. DC2W]|uniref:Coenzyme F420 hydrogenase/dehydrogenase, beta subunit C-terminal domain n=1 Tax=Arcicella gelida TaxID=2984195 RepID=A0ABU5S7V6_9BACT|nr:Coenzyme F420 hydrogenase/dehydrogenase, beta subunit C-terminal domain [Arcicella sp. DC2W]MEA5404556.1 Coenzyme F420 hydrogenase/dehydrogenase, beta subunit C-terminal domain [Arcicella sp. DC2W]